MDESPNTEEFTTHRAARAFAVEAMCMFILSSLVIGLRIYIRVRQVGINNLKADDYLMLLVLPFFASEIAVAFVSGSRFHGLLNSGMTDEERSSLLPESQEFLDRVNGSKFQIVAWCIYATIIWTIKASLCAFFFRLTAGLSAYRRILWVTMAILVATHLAVIACFLFACHPFPRNFQINPNPGNICQPALSRINLFVTLALNTTTDIILVIVPVPMFWQVGLPTKKKLGLILLFSGGLLVIVCGIIRCVLVVQDDEVGPHRAARWAVRECCLAIIASNIPIIWGWMRGTLKPLLSSLKARRAFKKRHQNGSIKLSDYPERSTFETGMKPATTRASLGHETTTSIVADADGHGKASLEFLSSSPAAGGGILKQTEVRIQTTTRDIV